MKSHLSNGAKISTFLVAAVLVLNCIFLVSCDNYNDILSVNLARGVAYVNADKELSERTSWNLLSVDDISLTIDNLKSMTFEPTDDSVSDVEYLKFDIVYHDGQTVKSVYLLYDYILKKEYILYEEELYLLHDYKELWQNNIKPQLYDCGDARIFRNSSRTDMSFRYEQHWTDGVKYEELAYFRCDISGINCPETQIESPSDAVKHLSGLLELTDCKAICFYDSIYEYYLVAFWEPTQNPIWYQRPAGNMGDNWGELFGVLDKSGRLVELYFYGGTIYSDLFEQSA